MAKQLKTEKPQQSGGIDPQQWQSAPAEAVGAVSNQDIAGMTGGDAATYEGIVDYILMEEERGAPSEGEILASEDVGLLERNFPEEVETNASLQPHETTGTASATETTTPAFSSQAGGLEASNLSGGDMSLGNLEEGMETSGPSIGGGQSAGLAIAGDAPGGISGGMEGGRVVDHKADDAKVFQAIGGPDPATLSAQNATALTAMDSMAQSLGAQVEGAAGGAMAKLAGAYSANNSTLDGAFGANLSLIQDSFAQARSSVDRSAMDAKTRVEGKAQEALADIKKGSAQLLADGDALIASSAAELLSQASSTEAQAMSAVTQAQGQAQAIANKWAAEAKKVGDAKAKAYRGRGNGGTEGKRDEARAQVAESYGEGYAEDLPNVGQEAVQTLEEEKKNIKSGIRELIRPLLTVELPTLQQNLHADVNKATDEARAGVEEGRDEAMSSIDEQHTAAGEQLATAESAAKTDLANVYGDSKTGLADMDSTGRESIEAMGAGIKFHIQEKSQQLRSVIAQNPALPLDALQKEVGSLTMALQHYATKGQAAIDATTADLEQTQAEYTQNAVTDMNSIGSTASENAQGLATEAATNLDSLATDFETGIDGLVDGFNTNLDTLRSQLNQNVSNVMNTAYAGLGSTLQSVKTGVADFLSGFDGDLNKAVNQEMVADIEAKAEEEAAKIKEPSLWDKVCAVVAVILIVVVVIAITVATAGVGTAVMGAIAAASIPGWAAVALTVVAGAAIGAVSSALTEIVMQIAATGSFNPADWDWKAIGVEALIGGVVGGLTAGLGVGLQAIGKWGHRAVAASGAVKAPALARIAASTGQWVDDAYKLTKVGEYAKKVGDTIIKEAATWAIKGEAPDLAKVAGDFALGAVTSEWAGGMTEALLPSSDPEWLKTSFSSFMEEIAKEAATGSNTEKILEKVEAPVADLGNVELTTDYKPEWSPTW